MWTINCRFDHLDCDESMASIDDMAKILQYANYMSNTIDHIVLDFRKDQYLSHAFSVVLLALKKICEQNGVQLTFRPPPNARNSNMIRFFVDTGLDEMLELSTQKRLAPLFLAQKSLPSHSNGVGVHTISVPPKASVELISKHMHLLSEEMVNIVKMLSKDDYKTINQIVTLVVEMYTNAICHSYSPIGAFSQCTNTPDGKFSVLTIYDGGVGIPSSVRQYKNDVGSDIEALKWAMQMANSTLQNTDNYPRGAGLPSLSDFITSQNGIMIIASGEAYYRNEGGKLLYETLSTPMFGTLSIFKLPRI